MHGKAHFANNSNSDKTMNDNPAPKKLTANQARLKRPSPIKNSMPIIRQTNTAARAASMMEAPTPASPSFQKPQFFHQMSTLHAQVVGCLSCKALARSTMRDKRPVKRLSSAPRATNRKAGVSDVCNIDVSVEVRHRNWRRHPATPYRQRNRPTSPTARCRRAGKSRNGVEPCSIRHARSCAQPVGRQTPMPGSIERHFPDP